jgi:hypothetical protein
MAKAAKAPSSRAERSGVEGPRKLPRASHAEGDSGDGSTSLTMTSAAAPAALILHRIYQREVFRHKLRR